MVKGRSDSATKCGICGGKAFTPSRFSDEDAAEMDGVFNVCGNCDAECTGTGAWGEDARYFWSGAREVAQNRARMAAMQNDAEWSELGLEGW